MALKRKIETESRNGPTASKVKAKVVETKKKPLTKNELLLKYKALEEKHEILVKDHDRNVQKITWLEKQKSPKQSKDQESQTRADFVEISCIDCIFLASSEDELNWHMGEEHEKDWISYFDTDFPCSVCDRWCKTQKELNRHIQVFHGKRVKSCSLGCHNCDENIVNKDGIDTNSVETQTYTEIDLKNT